MDKLHFYERDHDLVRVTMRASYGRRKNVACGLTRMIQTVFLAAGSRVNRCIYNSLKYMNKIRYKHKWFCVAVRM